MVCFCVCVRPPEDDQKEKSLSHHTIQQLIVEKDQALADLNSVEKSLADLFRRYEKMKDVLDGFRKVTDWLTDWLLCVCSPWLVMPVSWKKWDVLTAQVIVISGQTRWRVTGLGNHFFLRCFLTFGAGWVSLSGGVLQILLKAAHTYVFLFSLRMRRFWRNVPRSTWRGFGRRSNAIKPWRSTQRKNLTSESRRIKNGFPPLKNK